MHSSFMVDIATMETTTRPIRQILRIQRLGICMAEPDRKAKCLIHFNESHGKGTFVSLIGKTQKVVKIMAIHVHYIDRKLFYII